MKKKKTRSEKKNLTLRKKKFKIHKKLTIFRPAINLLLIEYNDSFYILRDLRLSLYRISNQIRNKNDLTEEIPVSSMRQEWHESNETSQCPGNTADHDARLSGQMERAEGKAEHQEPVQSDETDSEGGHLVRRQRQEPRDLTSQAGLPIRVVKDVSTLEQKRYKMVDDS